VIARTISFVGGNKSRAAQILGVGRRTLYKQPDRYKAYETNGHSNGRVNRNGRNSLTSRRGLLARSAATADRRAVLNGSSTRPALAANVGSR